MRTPHSNQPFVLLVTLLMSTVASGTYAQSTDKLSLFPEGTITYSNIPYAGDTLQKHQLDIYLPANAGPQTPVVIWIHGGAWMYNDKHADMGYMKQTVRSFIDSGYALASIDYRHSTDAHFPAQIQDCNQAVEYLYKHAKEYKLDPNRIALIGFSAGGHLATLLGLSNDNTVSNFYVGGKKPAFRIKAVVDFYGPSDLLAIASSPDPEKGKEPDAVSLLLGASAFDRPDLAKQASPDNYIDSHDPPFLIVQGEKDQSVPYTQSVLLHSWLKLSGVPADLIIVPGAPHYGEMFDAAFIRKRIFTFLRTYL